LGRVPTSGLRPTRTARKGLWLVRVLALAFATLWSVGMAFAGLWWVPVMVFGGMALVGVCSRLLSAWFVRRDDEVFVRVSKEHEQ